MLAGQENRPGDLGCTGVFYELLNFVVIGVLIYVLYKKLILEVSEALRVVIAIVLSLVAYQILSKIMRRVIELMCNCESLGVVDELFICDTDKNNMNIMICMFFDPFDYQSMKNHNLQTICAKTPRMKTKLVSIFGKKFHQYLSE